MIFARAQALADAVLMEGYVLYPYRVSSGKNRYRWTFGVLAPRSWSEAGGCEPWWLESQTLVEVEAGPAIRGRLRFFQIERREPEATPDGGATFLAVPSLELRGREVVPWEEGRAREVDFQFALRPGAPMTIPFAVEGERRVEEVRGADGVLRGRVVWEQLPVRGNVTVSCEAVEAERPLMRLTVRVENETPGVPAGTPRAEAVRSACVGAHLLFAVTGGAFVSLLDPPAWAAQAAKACRNQRTYPVLAGVPGSRDLVLSAPIILYDHAQIAPESHGDLFDATEIDEILTLRTSLLTEEEKREARATDPKAAAILDRIEALTPEQRESLHGTFRDLEQAEMVPRRRTALRPGSRVRILPGKRRTDAQDLLFVGCTARVEKVMEDVDGRAHVAVTMEDDPAAEMHRWYGRFHYYLLDEVEPIPDGEGR